MLNVIVAQSHSLYFMVDTETMKKPYTTAGYKTQVKMIFLGNVVFILIQCQNDGLDYDILKEVINLEDECGIAVLHYLMES